MTLFEVSHSSEKGKKSKLCSRKLWTREVIKNGRCRGTRLVKAEGCLIVEEIFMDGH